ncbi:MAG TPA: Ni/Fe-hydrogenase cytochrome b subunit [Desulfomicrobiaceae bacterium]|jgi:Ni/Fe-hydrogenase subunit HybB-like protein|nr:Ni/Fe-hydrogenase cytochrome b subunit [Desulfomicrobiaceae bacterium]
MFAGIDKRKLYTPFNIASGIILIIGAVLTVLRFTGGLSMVTNLDDNNPWGLWIGFDLLCGVALAAGGYVTSSAVYIFGMKKYHSAVRPAILTGFLGYSFVVFALMYDLGRPYRLPYPFVVQAGPTSFLFEVGLCVALYLTVLFIEFSPAAWEFMGWKKIRKIAHSLTIPLTIFGVVLSTLHQSSLGGLYLIAPSKLHPLWYSAYLPLFFFVSSIVAGLSMVMFEGSLAHKYYHDKMDRTHLNEASEVVLGFGKAAALVLSGYFVMKVIGIAVDNNWHYLATGWGAWFLVELIGFVALPALAFAIGVREKNRKLIQRTAAWAVLGIVVNRLNVSLIAFNWQLPAADRYFPSWMEIMTSLFIVTLGVTVYRLIVTFLPILHEHPEYKDSH